MFEPARGVDAGAFEEERERLAQELSKLGPVARGKRNRGLAFLGSKMFALRREQGPAQGRGLSPSSGSSPAKNSAGPAALAPRPGSDLLTNSG